MQENIKPNKTTYIKKGWGLHGLDGKIPEVGKEDKVGEIYAWHIPDEKPEHQFDIGESPDGVGTVKILYFGLNKRLSLHYHKDKEEIFTCALGNIEVITIDKQGKKSINILQVGDRIFIPRCTPHQMRGLNEKNILVEVSTRHYDEDSYRIEKGD